MVCLEYVAEREWREEDRRRKSGKTIYYLSAYLSYAGSKYSRRNDASNDDPTR